jgi:hypothetical protein
MDELIVSVCCTAPILADNICSICNKICIPVYANIECEECGGPIKISDNKCIDCNWKKR